MDKTMRLLRPLSLLLLIAVLWEVGVRVFDIPGYLIPAPWDVAVQLVEQFGMLSKESYYTAYAAIAGFALAVIFGVALGVIVAYSKIAELYLYPLLVFSQSVPKVAVAPLLVVWFGFDLLPKILIAFLLAVFPVIVSTVTGFKSIDPDYAYLAKSMRANRWRALWRINFPLALPSIFSGFKIAITLAVVGAVVGEFVGSNSGLGYVLQIANGNFDLPLMFAALVLLSLMGVVLFWMIELLEKVSVPWNAPDRDA